MEIGLRFDLCAYDSAKMKSFRFKGSSDPSQSIFQINVGKRRIRHRTTLNDLISNRFCVDREIKVLQKRIQFQIFEVRSSLLPLRSHDRSYLDRLKIAWRWHSKFRVDPCRIRLFPRLIWKRFSYEQALIFHDLKTGPQLLYLQNCALF